MKRAQPILLNDKIVSLAKLAQRAQEIARRKETLVLTNGCFDLLHVGHVRYLAQARSLGDFLAVALNSDISVRELKGKGRPINDEQDRAEVLAALASVDFVTIFSSVRATEVIEAVRPAVYVKGGDYSHESLNTEEREALGRVGARVEILPLVPGRSTSATLERLQGF